MMNDELESNRAAKQIRRSALVRSSFIIHNSSFPDGHV
jgi:hypothetical protein